MNKLIHETWKLRFLFLIFSIVLTVTSCSKKQDVSENSQQKVQVDILIDWQAEPTYLGIYHAIDMGFLSDLGFEATVTQSWGANEAVAAIANGTHFIGTSSGGATVLGRNNQANVVSLAVLYPNIPSVVYGLSSSGITKPQDLAGKRVGIYPGSVTVNEFEAFLSLNGLAKDDIEIVSLSGGDIPYLISGRIDAVLHYTEMSPVIVETGDDVPGVTGEKTFELKLAEYGVEGYGLNIIANPDVAAEKSIDLIAIKDALVRGYTNGCLNKAMAVELFLKRFPDKDPAYVTESWNRVCDLLGPNPGAQSTEGWEKTISLYRDLDLLTANVLPSDIMGN